MNNSQKLLATIKSKNIKQSSRYKFALKNILFWVLFFLSIIVGGLSFSIILFAFSQTDLDLLSYVKNSKIGFILSLLPVLWIFTCIVFLFIAIFGIKSTKTGYRYSPLLIYGSSVLISIIIGTILFSSGSADKLERIFAKNIPLYNSLEEQKVALWSMTDNGFLSGTIIKRDEDITLKDWNNQEWKVVYKDAIIRGNQQLNENETIKIIGDIATDNYFIAKEIRPWEGNGRQYNSNKHGGQ